MKLKENIAQLPYEPNYNPRTVLCRVLDCIDELKHEYDSKQLGHCLNCGSSFYGDVNRDILGFHMQCKDCGASFDIDTDERK